ncbi:threonine/serine exporter family protein [Solobacterium moorei]|uniref:Threonine/Serine exporter ThrE domain-containing protein n=1 Tax=Solobacterium moorei F0204 TaxID=706433 RepID=E7MMZ8_9FIRM|nr:threonine/serine exporter family protein [Solobacterium moorei]EFW24508.1 hypothetical protein HMPREF9430_00916 [Solobacterium moorei F0204]MDI6414790.1 threonine/serine exporter family protein [Solobacterium moorei]
MVNTILVLLLSFTASLGFSVTFGIHGKDKLLYAGLGGFLVRLVNITLSSFVQNHFVITLISALAASLYGEFMSRKLQVPSAYFIYPSIIPLIPGDMFHYMIASIVTGNIRLAEMQAFDCGLSLVALSLGTIIGTTALHSIRRK